MIQSEAPSIAELPSSPINRELTMGSPAIYKIQVRGNLDGSWADKFGGLQINSTAGKGRTIISGALSDQAALSGVLNTLYDLQLPVISVEHLPQPE